MRKTLKYDENGRWYVAVNLQNGKAYSGFNVLKNCCTYTALAKLFLSELMLEDEFAAYGIDKSRFRICRASIVDKE